MRHTACQRAFALPEILQLIFDSLLYSQDEDGDQNYTKKYQGQALVEFLWDSPICSSVCGYDEDHLKTLATCARVCESWFQEAIPILWVHRMESFFFGSLEDVFGAIEPARRQLYANHMVRASLHFRTRWVKAAVDAEILSVLTFPRLLGLQILIEDNQPLPGFDAPQLAWVDLDPHYESAYPEVWGADPEVYTPLFRSISERFPSLRRLSINDNTLMHADSLPLLQRMRPDIDIRGQERITLA
ncbi:hypothetical protein V2A60_002239 [Cordyceps javanica]